MAGKKLGKEAFHRMNYLYQAAKICQNTKDDGFKLSLYYGLHLKSIGHKAQCKMDPKFKRTLCKGCNTVLIPGETASIRLLKKPDPVLLCVCLFCGTYKVFRTREDYVIWSERPESVVQTSKTTNAVENQDLNGKVKKLKIQESDIDNLFQRGN